MNEWQPGKVILNEYIVERILGRGGMGEVWLVKSNSTGQRFAVKHALIQSEKTRKIFLAELQTWIDLPEHPNIVPCQFFRTIENDLVIFSDYVPGGSLKDWIDSGRINEGGSKMVLRRKLHIAIQFAWSLHIIHELGLVHQDVKPGNVLISEVEDNNIIQLQVQITDFGLARGRSISGYDSATESVDNSILLSSGGYTPAYCSPEQAKGLPVSRKTDQWSWGVAVLEMFTGGVTWYSGRVARAALDHYIDNVTWHTEKLSRSVRDQNAGEAIWNPTQSFCKVFDQQKEDGNDPTENLRVLQQIMEIIKVCFNKNPAKRWDNMGALVEALCSVYRATGEEYTSELKPISHSHGSQYSMAVRSGTDGAAWSDPRMWLGKALCLSGRDPLKVQEMIDRQGRSRRGHLVAEMAIYEEAKSIYLDLISKGRVDLEPEMADLCRNAALINTTADNLPGALAEYDKCIEILQRLVDNEGCKELTSNLTCVLMNKANALKSSGDLAGAVQTYDQGLAICCCSMNQGWQEMVNTKIPILMNKANALLDLGECEDAILHYDQCIKLLRRLVENEGRKDLAGDLARLLMNKAIALMTLDDSAGAVELYDQCITIWECLVRQEGQNNLFGDLARAIMNKAVALLNIGDSEGALLLCDQGIEILQKLVEQEGRIEWVNLLATAFSIKSYALTTLNDLASSVTYCDRCIEILRRLVMRKGRKELANELANALYGKAVVMEYMGDLAGVVEYYNQGVEIQQQLVEHDGRSELAYELAHSLFMYANALKKMDALENAVMKYDHCIEICRSLVDGRVPYILMKAVANRTELMGINNSYR